MATATASLKRMYIDGKWCPADNGRTLGVINPATEEIITEVAYGGRAETRRALEAAARAMPAWMKLTAWDRAKVLKKTADLMRERADATARTLTLEQGKPVAESKAEVLHSADTFEWLAEEGERWRAGCGDTVKRVSLELGGRAPFIVYPDADPEAGAKMAVTGKFRNNGQVCIAPSRFYVHKDVQKKFTEATVEFARGLKLGNGLEPGVEVGPMFEKRAMDQTVGLVEDACGCGAKILTGGKRSDRFAKGYFFEPTVLTEVPERAKMLTEEPFAPVMPLLD